MIKRSGRCGSHNASGISLGFTLLELVIVLAVLGLLIFGLLGPLSTQFEQERREQTVGQIEEIKNALLGFSVANRRLPCPDCTDNQAGCASIAAAQYNDGIEDRIDTDPSAAVLLACARAYGNLPYQDLGVRELDGWDNQFLYRVTILFAREAKKESHTAPCGVARDNVAFELCSVGDITVRDSAGGAIIASQVPALFLSRGNNRNIPASAVGGDLSNQEQENEDSDTEFVSKGFSRDDAQEFDDIVEWISPNILRNRMISSGQLP